MPELQFGLSSYERAEGDLPGLPVVNMYAEQTGSEGVVLQSRPEVADRLINLGDGPVEALFKRDGVVSSQMLAVSGGNYFRDATSAGAVTGSGPFRIEGNEIGAMIATGGTLYFDNGTTLSTVAFPDGADVADVFVGNSRYWMIRKDTGKIYYTDALESDVEALDFVTAESLPDRLLQGLWIDGIAILFGQESVEFWPGTTSDETPIQPLQGRVIERGIRATGCASPLGSGFFWITDQSQVCLNDENNVISNPGIQERLAASTTCQAFRFFIDGQEFGAVRFDNETQVYSLRTGLWSEFTSEGQANWLPQCHADGVFGSAVDGKTMQWGQGRSDLGGVLERRFRAGYPLDGDSFPVVNLRLRCNPGKAPVEGTYADPIVEMRLSRDAGQTWGNFKPTSLGKQGEYRKRIEWRGLGQASAPGFLCEFRVTDPVDFRVSNVKINEPWGGR